MNKQKQIKVICLLEALDFLNDDKSPINRRYWVHPLNKQRETQFQYFYTNIRQYPEKFFEYFRMSITSFDELLGRIRESIAKKMTVLRMPISVEERLSITLR